MANAGNWLKTPVARTLNEFAENKVRSALDLLGQSLPAKVVSRAGAIVTIEFLVQSQFTLPRVQVPLAGSEYVRLPIQAGCLGWVMTADAYLGGVSGLGGGTASLTPRANLSMLVFSPIGNKNWTASDDDRKLVLYGPDGVVIRDQESKNKITIDKTAGITIDVQNGGVTINISSLESFTLVGNGVVSGNWRVNGNLEVGGEIQGAHGETYPGNLKIGGDVIAGFGTGDQVTVQNHTHEYDRPSGASTPAQTVKPTAGT